MPAGRAGHGSGSAEHQATEVQRVEAVDILVRVDGEKGLLLVETVGQGQLDQERADLRVGVHGGDGLEHFGLGGARGQMLTGRVHADARAVLVLHGHIARTRTVVADEDRAQPDGHVPRRPSRPPGRPPLPDAGRDGSPSRRIALISA